MGAVLSTGSVIIKKDSQWSLQSSGGDAQKSSKYIPFRNYKLNEGKGFRTVREGD